jgi:hypothetical protein
MPNAKTVSSTTAGRARSAPVPYASGAGAAGVTAAGAPVANGARVVAAATLGRAVDGPRGATLSAAGDCAGGAGGDGADGDGAAFGVGVDEPTFGVGRARSVDRRRGTDGSGERSSPGATTIGCRLRGGSVSSRRTRSAAHEHPTAGARSSTVFARPRSVYSPDVGSPGPSSRTTRSIGGRARWRRAGSPPGVDSKRRQRPVSVSETSLGCAVSEIPWRCSEARNPEGENLASIDGSAALGQSPTYVTSSASPYNRRRYRAAATAGDATDRCVGAAPPMRATSARRERT